MKKFLANSVVLTLLFLPSWGMAAGLLEELRYSDVDGPAVIEIQFATPMLYVSHIPKDKSDFIEVYLKIRDTQVVGGFDDVPNQNLKAPESSSIPLTSVGLEVLRDGNVKLTVLFSEALSFLVSQGTDPNRLLITLPDVTYVHMPSDKVLQRTMEKARDQLKNGEYAGAINLYMSVLSLPVNTFQQEALEYLGIARERNGQTAQAKAVYEEYLEKYKEGSDHFRIKQRLADLLSDQFSPKAPLPVADVKKEKRQVTEVFGSFNQYFNYAENNITGLSSSENIELSQVLTSIDINSRTRHGSEEWRFNFYADEAHDLNRSQSDPIEINTLSGSYRDRSSGIKASLGRQTSRGGGISGRFDGLVVNREFTKKFAMEMVAGYPVLLSDKQHVQIDRPAVSASMIFSNVFNRFDIKPYGVAQYSDEVLNRAAIGSELSYFNDLGFVYTLLDYDTQFKEMNILYSQGQYKLAQDTIANFVFDVRKSPSLEMENALISEFRVSEFNDLTDLIGLSQVQEQALKRTGMSYMASMGISRELNSNIQIGADVTRSDQVYQIPNGDDVTYQHFHDKQYDVSSQLIIANLTEHRDTTLFDVRYSDAEQLKTVSWSARYRVSLSNHLQLDLRAWRSSRVRSDSQRSVVTRPSVKLTYQTKTRFRGEIEAGREWNESSGGLTSEDYERFFMNMVYRWVF